MAERGALVAAAARRVAWLAFCLVIVLAPFRAVMVIAPRSSPQVATAFTAVVVSWGDLALLVTLGAWIVATVVDGRRIELGPRWLGVPVAGLLAITWGGIPWAVDPPLAGYVALRLLLVVALALYVANELDRPERLAWPVALMIAIQAVVVVGQVAGQHSLGLASLGETVLDPVRGLGSILASDDGRRILRGYGLSSHPNILGGILAVGLLTLAATLGPGGQVRIVRIARTAVIAAGIVALFLTFSRGAWLGFGTGLALLLAMLIAARERVVLRRWLGAVAIGGLLCVPLVLPLGPYLAARANLSGPVPTEARSINERIVLAEATVTVALDRPLLGTGIGGLPLVLRDTRPDFELTYLPAHVAVLVAAAETGIVGGLCYLAILVGPWVALIRRRGRWTPWLSGASGALAAITVAGLFDYYTWTASGGRLWAWIALGAWVAAARVARVVPAGRST